MKSHTSSVIIRDITCLTVSLAFLTSTALIINFSLVSIMESLSAVTETEPSTSPGFMVMKELEILKSKLSASPVTTRGTLTVSETAFVRVAVIVLILNPSISPRYSLSEEIDTSGALSLSSITRLTVAELTLPLIAESTDKDFNSYDS